MVLDSDGVVCCVEFVGCFWFGGYFRLMVVAALLVTKVEPVTAKGSGMPEIKCYLNGVKVQHVLRCLFVCWLIFLGSVL